MEIQITKITCEKCGHKRIPRTTNPIKCPVCGHRPGTKIRNKTKTNHPQGEPA